MINHWSTVMMASSTERSFINKLTSVVGLDNVHFNRGRENEPRQATSEIVTAGTRNIYKAVIPRFLFKPPFGYPRFVDIPELRRLAQTPYVEMAIATITDEIAAVPWDIVPEDETLEDEPGSVDEKCQKVKAFFDNPNCNKENFASQLRKIIRDILEVDSGVWVKVFDNANRMSQLFVRDGGTFIMNPDIFGTFDGKEDFIFPDYQNTLMNPNFYIRTGERAGEPKTRSQWDTLNAIAEKAAYFQYGWITGARPMPFGTREIVYMMRNPRADSIYGQSPIEICLDMIQMLVYGIDHNLDYFTDNNVPKGVFKMIGAGKDEVDDFRTKWREATRTKDEVGNYRKRFHHMPVINVDGTFEKIQFSNAELELITQQEWFTKLLWACFGVTPSELGFTEDSNRATEIVQSRVFRRKAIRPLLSLLEYHINTEIIPEFEKGVVINYGQKDKEEEVKGITGVKFKFDMHDITEEIQKNELYEIQIRNKIRTPNEIRELENLPPVEGGDGFPQFNPFGQPGQPGQDQEGQDQGKMPGENEFEREDDEDGEDKAALKQFDDVLDRVSMKAHRTDSPLVPRQFEQPAKEMIKIFNSVFMTQKKKIYEMIDVYAGGKRPEAKDLNKQVIKMIKDILSTALVEEVTRKAVEASYLKAIEETGTEYGRNFLPDKKNVTFIIEHALDNVKGMAEAMKDKMRAELERGIMAGEGISKLKSRITGVFDMASTRAETIARTETSRAENVGLIDAYAQAGVKGKKEWVAHIDGKTCPDCRRLNGKTVQLAAQFKSADEVINPPLHPNCRCRTIFKPEE